ncbi:dihydrofolate reductase [Candidatus Nomurabacteria bacterium]|nr:dihydrofolate reductase [Candidatus Nomurabacteria bacterium]
MITLIAAIGKNNELGKSNDLVWKLPADQKHFRERTTGHTMIMGRKTFESLGQILPNRRHIVITRDKNYSTRGVDVAHSLEEAVKRARTPLAQDEEIFIIGGAEIFNQAMDTADRLDITHIDGEDRNADTFFPEIIPIVWNEISHEEHQKDEKNPFNYTFSVYERI